MRAPLRESRVEDHTAVVAGAQLAGTSQHKLASHMIDKLSANSSQGATSGRFRGVVFYATMGAGLPSSIGQ